MQNGQMWGVPTKGSASSRRGSVTSASAASELQHLAGCCERCKGHCCEGVKLQGRGGAPRLR